MNIIDKINNYLIDSENFADEFLPLRETLTPIQSDFNTALNELKQKINESDDLSDKVFYLNRYTDLVKRLESVFDTRNKRLQQTISLLSKLPEGVKETSESEENIKTNGTDENNVLSPEQANEILKILNNK